MSTRSSWLLPLQGLAAALGVAIVALLVAWVRLEPAPPIAPTASPDGSTPPAPHAGPANAAVHDAASTTAATPATAPDTLTPTAPAAPSAVLFGTVKRADGSLIADGYCWLTQGGKQVGSASLRGGTFAFAGLRPGTHQFTSRIADELTLARDVAVQAPSTRLDLELPPRWSLRVDAVTPDSAPLVEMLNKQRSGLLFRALRALASPDPLAGDLPSIESSEIEAGLGPFRSNDPFGMREQKPLPKQTVGVLTLPPDQRVHIALLLGGALLAQQQASPGQESITFVLAAEAVLTQLCVVHFRCVDPTGAPVVGARVSMSSLGGMSSGEKMVTDGQGRYVARNLLPGRVSVGVWHKELRMPPLELDLAAGADVDLGDITMRLGATFEWTWADFGGEGNVRLCWLDAPSNTVWRASSQGSVESDRFSKNTLFPGRYGVFARGKNGVALVEIDTAALPPGPLRFALQRGASLQIDNRIGAGFACFQIATARGVPVHRGELGSRPGYALELPPGDYVATVDAGGGRTTKRAFVLPASGTTLSLP